MNPLLLYLLSACGYKANDADEDGYWDSDDCDPNDPKIGGTIDAFVDDDGDGYGASDLLASVCAGTAGYADNGDDCNDADAATNPSAAEVCDEIDNDCNSLIDDEDDNVTDATTWYADSDGDGYGDELDTTGTLFCDDPESGYAATNDDCNDSAADYYPGAPTECDTEDRNCDDIADIDDGDGDGLASCEGDCNDTDPSINPSAFEECDPDDVDENCNGYADDADPDGAEGKVTRYTDADNDGYGDTNDATGTDYCDPPSSGVSTTNDDCDDANSAINPVATEICDTIDNDCDGATDDDDSSVTGQGTWYADSDGDGYGDESDTTGTLFCDDPGSGYAATNTDCDDSDSSINPSATEICDASDTDEDCDGLADDDDSSATGKSSYYTDIDGDGYGDETASAVDYCDPPAGVAATNDDCDDGDSSTHPASTDTCFDGMDSNCDGTSDGCEPATNSLADADAKLIGETDDNDAGRSLAPAGDFDADGFDDILVGAYGESSAATGAGAVYVVYGPVSGSVDLSTAGAKLLGEADGDMAGYAVSSAGDVDGDGNVDLIVGAYQEDGGGSDAGAAYIVYGPLTGTADLSSGGAKLIGEAGGDLAGYSTSSAGDMDGDGNDDVLVGAIYNDAGGITAGAAYLVHGPVSGTRNLSGAEAILLGEDASDSAGWAVASAGDVYGDGTGDILIGAIGNDSAGLAAGMAYLIDGPVSGAVDLSAADGQMEGVEDNAYAGTSVAPAGDHNGDGYDDMLVGASGESSGAGAAYLVLGPLSGSLSLSGANARFTGENTGDSAGTFVSSAGDPNDDGTPDILVGAPSNDGSAADAGAVYLIYGPATGTTDLSDAEVKFTGEAASDAAGSVAPAGDVDGDAIDDFLAGAPAEDSGGSDAGAAYLILGREF
ncbi:MAG: FG-GAP repeat protein [Deltaproteobacteria bacterium]|nr:FG-GAP repeat protein [Deltaproteobacteria bacterium]